MLRNQKWHVCKKIKHFLLKMCVFLINKTCVKNAGQSHRKILLFLSNAGLFDWISFWFEFAKFYILKEVKRRNMFSMYLCTKLFAV